MNQLYEASVEKHGQLCHYKKFFGERVFRQEILIE